jgi:hypothetical protein
LGVRGRMMAIPQTALVNRDRRTRQQRRLARGCTPSRPAATNLAATGGYAQEGCSSDWPRTPKLKVCVFIIL